MKTLSAILIIILTATLTQAADWCWLSMGPTNVPNVQIYDMSQRGKTGDAADYDRMGHPRPSLYPALVDATTGDMVIAPATLAAGKAAIRARQKADVTSETPKFFDLFTLSTNTMALIGTNRTGFALLRYDGTKLTTAQREQYQTECIQYLSARLQLLERALKQTGIVSVKEMIEGETP